MSSHSELLAEEPQAANLQLRSRVQLLLPVLCGNLHSGCAQQDIQSWLQLFLMDFFIKSM